MYIYIVYLRTCIHVHSYIHAFIHTYSVKNERNTMPLYHVHVLIHGLDVW